MGRLEDALGYLRCGRTSGGELSPETRERMRRANPAVIPRNHRVEEALEAAVQSGDLEPFNRLLEAVQNPYEERPELAPYRACPLKRSPVILRPSAELSRREEPARTEPQTQKCAATYVQAQSCYWSSFAAPLGA